MSTRHLIVVKKDAKVKIAQYGQWDGYLGGQGKDILDFLNNKENIILLKESLSKVRFIDEAKDKKFIQSYEKNTPWSNEPDNRTEKQKRWFENYIDRDLGSKILINVAQSQDKEILLKNNIYFADDGLFCEYAYVIDFDKNMFSIYRNGFKNLLKEYNIDYLPTEKEFLKLDKEVD